MLQSVPDLTTATVMFFSLNRCFRFLTSFVDLLGAFNPALIIMAAGYHHHVLVRAPAEVFFEKVCVL